MSSTENDAVYRAGLEVAGGVEMHHGEVRAFVVPEGGDVRVIDLDKPADRNYPERKTGIFQFRHWQSFVEYVRRHGDGATEVWADVDGQSVTAVINGHEIGTPGWGDHRAVYAAVKTPAWKAWREHQGLGPALVLAEHIESWRAYIVEPSAAEMLEVVQSFKATTKAQVESGTRLSSGEVQFVYREEIQAKAGKAGQLSVPEEFTISVAPFRDSLPEGVLARVRYRLNDGVLSIGYVLDQPEQVEERAFESIVEQITDQLSEGVDLTDAEGLSFPVFSGSPSPSRTR